MSERCARKHKGEADGNDKDHLELENRIQQGYRNIEESSG